MPERITDKRQAIKVVSRAINRIERLKPVPSRARFTFERVGTDIRVACWCGKSRLLSTQMINVFCKNAGDFMYEHTMCEPREGA
jgi:hypothetical protein